MSLNARQMGIACLYTRKHYSTVNTSRLETRRSGMEQKNKKGCPMFLAPFTLSGFLKGCLESASRDRKI